MRRRLVAAALAASVALLVVSPPAQAKPSPGPSTAQARAVAELSAVTPRTGGGLVTTVPGKPAFLPARSVAGSRPVPRPAPAGGWVLPKTAGPATLTAQTFPGATGETDTYAPDPTHAVTAVRFTQATSSGTTELGAVSYTYDGSNGTNTEFGTGLGAQPQNYGYYPTGRLSQAGAGPALTSYVYDPAGNPTQQVTPAGATTSTYDAGDQLCWTAPTPTGGAACTGPPSNATTYRFDAAGDRTTEQSTAAGTRQLAYTEAGQLSQFTGSPENSFGYTYDGDGLRTTRTGYGTTQHFTWDQSTANPLLLADGTNTYVYGLGEAPLEQIAHDGTVTYLHTDATGSVRLATDGATVDTRTYEPYGATLSETHPGTTPFGFNGEYQDPESGLYYLRARFYDPTTQQFLTLDPLGAGYAYAGGDPLNNSDPTGLACHSDQVNSRCANVSGLDEAIRNADPFYDAVASGGQTVNDVRAGASAGTIAGDVADTAADTALAVAEVIPVTAEEGVAADLALQSGRDIVEAEARNQASKGLAVYTDSFSGAMNEAIAKTPWRLYQFLGTAVHEATARALRDSHPERFKYYRVGPDFRDTTTGTDIELTTDRQVKPHMKRGVVEGRDYASADYSTYTLPRR